MTVWVAGVDGCRAGWIAALRHVATGAWHFRFARTLTDIVDSEQRPRVIAIDMPTGFAERAERGGRACESAARRLLVGRTSCVFSTPCRAALEHKAMPGEDAYRAACDVNRANSSDGIGLSQQAFHLFNKMLELDTSLRCSPSLKKRVFEAHPELAFMRMNDEQPVRAPKHTTDGQVARQRLLMHHGFRDAAATWESYRKDAGLRRRDAALNDALDAAAVCVTAHHTHRHTARCLPTDRPPRDCYGLPMAIWY